MDKIVDGLRNFNFNKNRNSQAVVLWCTVGIVSLGLPYAICTHIFRGINRDDASDEYRAWIRHICGGSAGDKERSSIQTFGFFKASLRRFLNDMRLTIFPEPQAILGQPAPDSRLVDISTGRELSFLRDFVESCPPGVPLVMNMGSYT